MFCVNTTTSEDYEDKDWVLEKRKDYIVQRRDPWFAAFASLIMPGAGQFYNRDWIKGGINLLGITGWISLISYTESREGEEIRPYADFGALCLLGHWVFSPVDAYCSAIHKNTEIRRTLGLIDVGLYRDKIGIGLSYKF